MKHPYHYHKLVLVKSKVEGDENAVSDEDDSQSEEDDSREYYCDACELRRNTKNPV